MWKKSLRRYNIAAFETVNIGNRKTIHVRDGHKNCGTSIKEEINFHVISHDKYYLEKKREREKKRAMININMLMREKGRKWYQFERL